jgi:hypothetical protein
MANYTKTVDFAAKDSLVSGDTNKRIRGSEINTELNNVQTAVNSKLDSSGYSLSTITGTLAINKGGTGTANTAYCNLASNVTGTLTVPNGGTGVSSFGGTNHLLATATANILTSIPSLATSVVVADGSGVIGFTQGLVPNRVLRSTGSAIGFSEVDVGTDVVGTLAVANGGTGGTDSAIARFNLDVPQRNGTDATGTWSISISGNAATATSATNATNATNSINCINVTGTVAIANGGTGQTTASAAANALGVNGAGQSWASFLASRAINTNYQNTTGRPISVSITLTLVTAAANNPILWVHTASPATSGVAVAAFTNGTTGNINVTVGPVIIPNQHYYQVQAAVGTSIVYWAELR